MFLRLSPNDGILGTPMYSFQCYILELVGPRGPHMFCYRRRVVIYGKGQTVILDINSLSLMQGNFHFIDVIESYWKGGPKRGRNIKT